MKRFFLHADRRLWEDHLLPGFFTHLELSPDFFDCVMAVVEDYINFRLSPENDDIATDPQVRHQLVCSIVNDEGLCDVDTVEYASLLDTLYRSVYVDLMSLRQEYNLYFVSAEYAGTSLIGFTGEFFNATRNYH